MKKLIALTFLALTLVAGAAPNRFLTLHVPEQTFCAVETSTDGIHWRVTRHVTGPKDIRLRIPARSPKFYRLCPIRSN